MSGLLGLMLACARPAASALPAPIARAPIVIPAQAGTRARDEALLCLRHPAALGMSLRGSSGWCGVYWRWRPRGFLPAQE